MDRALEDMVLHAVGLGFKMQCTSPIYIFPVGEVPCGKCMACRIRRTSEWGMRIMHECSNFEHSCFLTLTYNNDNLPLDGSLSKIEVQLFLKRLRHFLNGRKIKYYFCGEYGELNKRPHYHGIVFGVAPFGNDLDIVKKSWVKGFLSSKILVPERARYVAGYVQKKLSGIAAIEEYGLKLAPFSLMSKGIGKDFVNNNVNYLLANMGLTVNGVKHSLPRYYRKLLDGEIDGDMLDALRFAAQDELAEFYKRNNIVTDEAKRNYIKLYRAQKEAEIKSKLQMHKPRKF